MSNKNSDWLRITDEFTIKEDIVFFTRKIIQGEETSQTSFELKPINLDELFEERHSGRPGLVFKNGSSFYYTSISREMRFFTVSNIGPHLCADCGHMSALPDCEGGCLKVREKALAPLERTSKSTLRKSKRIEKYSFVTMGYESFNTKQDSLLVLSCNNRVDIPPRPQVSPIVANHLKLSLVEFYDDGEVFDKI